jgi:hypothetical protein
MGFGEKIIDLVKVAFYGLFSFANVTVSSPVNLRQKGPVLGKVLKQANSC